MEHGQLLVHCCTWEVSNSVQITVVAQVMYKFGNYVCKYPSSEQNIS